MTQASEQSPYDHLEASIRTVPGPADTNANGDIFGGWLMSQMDIAGGMYAYRKAQGRIVTVAVEAMVFHQPVKVGDEVSIFCQTERQGKTSISIKIDTWVKRALSEDAVKVTEAVFTFVAIDARGKPRPIPAIPNTQN